MAESPKLVLAAGELSGYIYKRGEGVLGKLRWNRRYAVVRGRFMQYWETQEEEQETLPKGSIDLSKVIRLDGSMPPDGSPELFYITLTLVDRREVSFYMESQYMHNTWMKGLKAATEKAGAQLSSSGPQYPPPVEDESIFGGAINALSSLFGMDAVETMQISAPKTMHHQAGIKKTKDGGFTCEFENYADLPADVKVLLGSAGFTEKEVEEDRQAIIQVLKFQQRIQKSDAGGGAAGTAGDRRAEVMLSSNTPPGPGNTSTTVPSSAQEFPSNGGASSAPSFTSSAAAGFPVQQRPPAPARTASGVGIGGSARGRGAPPRGGMVHAGSSPAVAGRGRGRGGPPPRPRRAGLNKENLSASADGDSAAAAPAALPMAEEVVLLENIVSKGDPASLYINMKMIGEGASGRVFVADCVRTKERVAVKQMVLARQPKPEVLVNEVMLMQKCTDASIVRYKDSYLVEGVLWVIMELIDGEDLTTVLEVLRGTGMLSFSFGCVFYPILLFW